MKPDLRQRALKAYHLSTENITGEELGARLKTSADNAHDLANIGVLIERAEARRLPRRLRDVMKVIARVIARQVMLGRDWAKTSEIDFAAGKRSGWCGKVLVQLTSRGLIIMPQPGRLTFTDAGWAFAWATGLIKPSWKVPT